MRFILLHKLVTYLMAGLGLFSLSLGSELSDFVLIAITIGFVASFFAEGRFVQSSLYGSLWTLAVVLFLLWQIARGVMTEPTLAMAMEFAAILQISRLFNRRSANDYQQIAALAFLHLVAATILTTNLIYAGVFLGFVIVTPWMLTLSNLRREIESNYSGSHKSDRKAHAAIRRVLASKRVVGPGFLLGTATLSVPLFVMTLAIFIVVPRVGKGFFSFQRDKSQRVTGFGNLIELGGFGVIRDDPTVVLRINPLSEKGPRPDRKQYRLRGTSFDHYDGRRWTRVPSNGIPIRRGQGYYPIRRFPNHRSDQRLQIILDQLEQRVVFIPQNTVALDFSNGRSPHHSAGPKLILSPGLDLRYIDQGSIGLVYTAYTHRNAQQFEPKSLDSEVRERYLQLPYGHQFIISLARKVTANSTGDRDKIRSIYSYLHDSSRFSYSLKQPDVGSKPPLEVFLLEVKKGHCEYFSTAMAIMLRAVGVPSRNVTGFLGGRYNPFGDYYALRQGDAHSWVEAFVEDYGWMSIDPTPSAELNREQAEGIWSDINALFDAIRTRWTTSVVAYDLQTQVGILQELRRILNQLRYDSHSSSPTDNRHIASPFHLNLRQFVLWVIGMIAVTAITYSIYRMTRQRKQIDRIRKAKNSSEAVKLYRELERILNRNGYPRVPSETPLEHAHRLADHGFPQAQKVEEIIQYYMEARFGDYSFESYEFKRLRSMVRGIRTRIRS